MSHDLKRINKFLSEIGYCSRRAADKLIDEKRVTINGKVPEMGTKISSSDEVRVDSKLVSKPKFKVLAIFYTIALALVLYMIPWNLWFS